MSSYTPGPWRVGPPIFDGDVIFAPPQTEGHRNEVVAMGILNKADAQLIAAAPELVDLCIDLLIHGADAEPIRQKARGILMRIYKLGGEDDV